MGVKLTYEEMTARLEQTISNPVRVIEKKTRGPNLNGSKPRVQLPAALLAELVPADGETETRFNKTFADGQVARFVINHLRLANKAAGRGLKVTWVDSETGKTRPVASKSDEGKQVDELVKTTEPVEIQFWSGPKNANLTGRPPAVKETREEQAARENASPALNNGRKGRAAPKTETDEIFSGINV